MGKTRNTGYLQNIVQYDGSNNIILPSLVGTGTRMVVTAANGTLSYQDIPTVSNIGGVPTTRTITINGTSQDLSANRTWTLYTDDISEDGSPVNLWFTNARARAAISVTGSGSYDSATGVITVTGGVTSVNTLTGAVTLTTTNIGEGTNLYYTSARVNSDFDTRLATKSTTNLAEGTNLYYTDARVGTYLTNNSYATQSYVSTQINNLVSGAPGLLDTLDELAAALGDDPNFATTVSTALSNRLRIDINTQGLTSTQQGNGRTNLGLGSLATLSSVANAQITDVAWSKVTGAPAFITGYTEVDTLASVTARGSSTTGSITINGYTTIAGGADLNLKAASGNTDTGDIVFQDGSGNELHRLWQGSSTLNYRTNGGTTYSLWHSGNLTNLNQLTNGPGYITSYTETDTLATVTARGATTTAAISVNSVTGSITSSGSGDSNAPFRFGADYSGWMTIVAGTPGSNNGWGLFWAGNSGAQYGTNGTGGPGDIWTNSTNPNEYVFVGNGQTNMAIHGNTGNVWIAGTLRVAGAITGTLSGNASTATSATQVVTIQDTAPSTANGKLWWESTTGKLKVYYSTSSAWVDVLPMPDMNLYYAKAGGAITGNVNIQQSLTVDGVLNMNTTGTSYIRMGRFPQSLSNSGEAWIGRAGDRSAGTMTVQLGGSSNGSFFEIVDHGWTTVTFKAGMNDFSYKGNTIYHAGNLTNLNQLTNGPGYITSSSNISGYSASLGGYANQTIYTILDGPANGPVIKIRYDSATANRYIDIGSKDGNNVYSEGLKLYNGTSMTWRGNTVLDAGNYNSYSPTLTGGGASGTWSINVTGSAGSAGSATYADRIQTGNNQWTWSQVAHTATNPNTITLWDQYSNYGGAGSPVTYGTIVDIYGRSAHEHDQLLMDSGGEIRHRNCFYGTNAWNGWRVMLDSSNYNSYSPTLTGGGASGTWGISISGNAATATSATSASSATTAGSATSATQVVTIQDSAPSGVSGKLWWESDTGRLKVYYSAAWVDASPIPDMSLYYPKAGGSITGDVTVGQTLNVIGNTLIQGNINAFGDITAYSSSDIRLKDNITPIESPLDKISKINGVTFNWNDKQSVYETGKKDYGVIAQEIEEVLPELVATRENGYKAVRYEKIVPLLIESIKEQQVHINELKSLVNMLTEKLNNL